MKYCPNCQAELQDGAKFCPYCGMRMEPSQRIQAPQRMDPSQRLQAPQRMEVPQQMESPQQMQAFQQMPNQGYQGYTQPQGYPQQSYQPYQNMPPMHKAPEPKKPPIIPIILGTVCGLLAIVLIVLVVIAKPWERDEKKTGRVESSETVKDEDKEASEQESEKAESSEEETADSEKADNEADPESENAEEDNEGEESAAVEKEESSRSEEAPNESSHNEDSNLSPTPAYEESIYAELIEIYKAYYNGEISLKNTPDLYGPDKVGVLYSGMYSGAYYEDENGFVVENEYVKANMIYTLYDVNSDGRKELIVAEYSPEYNYYEIHDIWTIVDGKPLFVIYADARFDIHLMTNGNLFRIASAGAAWTYYYEFVMFPNGTMEILFEGATNDGAPYINGEDVTEEELFAAAAEYETLWIDLKTLEWETIH